MIVSHVGGSMTNGNTGCMEKLFFSKYYSSYLAFPASGNVKLLFRGAGMFWIAILQVIAGVLVIQQTTSSSFSCTFSLVYQNLSCLSVFNLAAFTLIVFVRFYSHQNLYGFVFVCIFSCNNFTYYSSFYILFLSYFFVWSSITSRESFHWPEIIYSWWFFLLPSSSPSSIFQSRRFLGFC
jgi:hypothetical protein